MGIPILTPEQREQYGNRTFDRALYIYTAEITKEVMQPHPGGEMHRTGRTVRDPIKWSVVAPSREFADFAFGDRFDKHGPTGIEVEVHPICAEISDLRHR